MKLVDIGYLTWKEKTLDYEIETWNKTPHQWVYRSFLKRKDPRLRDWNNRREKGEKHPLYGTWKEKTLDYEIETGAKLTRFEISQAIRTWKEKTLDYEIETT